MRLKDVFCFLLFTITIAASYVDADDRIYEVSKSKARRPITKRDAAIFIDNFPIEPIYRPRPSKIIYRRISKQKYRPKPVYGPPVTKYRSKSRKPVKKYRRVKPKYGPPIYKRRPTKPKYGPPKPIKYKPVYGPPKKVPQSSYYSQEPAGFGEPPTDEYQAPQQDFGEPPIDSYGSPLNLDAINPYIPEQYPPSFSEPSADDNLDTNFGTNFKSWPSFQADQNFDNKVAYSKKRQKYTKPEPFEPDEDFDPSPYTKIYKSRGRYEEEEPFERKKRPSYKKEYPKSSRRPKPVEPEIEDEVIVGGRYAEPPARFVPKYPSYILQSEDDEFPPLKEYVDPDITISATISPYVNYKHSNMAFSPQNLNDAFSIVD